MSFRPSSVVLRRVRLEAGWTQQQLAEAVGVKQPLVSRWEDPAWPRERMPADRWACVRRELSLGSGSRLCYALAHITADTNSDVHFLFSGERLRIVRGGLATKAADMLQMLGHDVHAVPLAAVEPVHPLDGPDAEMLLYLLGRFLHEGPEADLAHGKQLAQALAEACRETGSPVVPTPVADAIREMCAWGRQP